MLDWVSSDSGLKNGETQKKTLSSKEIQTMNKKCREKVINSGNNVFDAFIHIGCFKGDVDFDKKIEGTKKKYKQSILE